MSIDEQIRAAVRAELSAFEERMGRLFSGGVPAEPLTTLRAAARACGITPETLRRRYLGKLKRYGTGHRTRISLAELQEVMAAEARGEAADNADDAVERIEARRRNRRSRRREEE